MLFQFDTFFLTKISLHFAPRAVFMEKRAEHDRINVYHRD